MPGSGSWPRSAEHVLQDLFCKFVLKPDQAETNLNACGEATAYVVPRLSNSRSHIVFLRCGDEAATSQRFIPDASISNCWFGEPSAVLSAAVGVLAELDFCLSTEQFINVD